LLLKLAKPQPYAISNHFEIKSIKSLMIVKLSTVVMLLRRRPVFPTGTAIVVAGAARAAGFVAAAHLQLQRRRQVHRLALKISCKNN
jgi:hypothetical protein